MIYARQAAHGARLGRRKLFAAGGTALILASLTIGIAAATPSSFLELDGNVISNGTGTYDWANSGALTTTGGTYSRAGTGGIFNGGHFNGNTTPPTAPTRTAAALADGSIADAEFKVDPLSVDVTSCGTGDPTAYTGAGGETNGDLLSSDTFGTAAVPNKDDLSNVYAVAHVSGSVNEVFFGAERVINNGDSHIDFEFLQSAVTIPNACSGSFAGHRTQGDFLLSVDFTNGGTLGGTILYKWQCDTVLVPSKDGTVCDPGKGKNPAHYQSTGTTAVVIKVNDASVGTIGCGGWVCRLPNGTPTTTILQNELMEGGIDLAQLGFTGCISTFLPHTRSSQSFTATLKDFEIIPFNTCKAPTVSTTLSATTGKIGDTIHDGATLTGATADAGGTVTYTMYTNNTCTLGARDAGTKTVVNGIVPDSDGLQFNSAGTFYWQAVYSGDARNTGSSSVCTDEVVVIHANPTISTTLSATTGKIGDTIHDGATLTGATADAGGTVTYTMYTNNTCTLGARDAGTKTVVNGIVPDSDGLQFNSAGTFYWQAVYSGDANNNGATSTCTDEVVVIRPNPGISTTLSQTIGKIGDTVHDSSNLTGATADAGGTVTYTVYTNNTCTLGARDAGTKTVVNGIVPDSDGLQFNSAGTFYWQAVYSGDANNNGATSACTDEVVVIHPNPTISTTLSQTTGKIGDTVHDSSTLAGGITADAGGTVTYTVYTNNTCTLGARDAGTKTVVNGIVPDSDGLQFNSAGTFYWQAVYSGDANNNGATSTCTDEVLVISPSTPAPHSTPVVQIKDTFTVTGFAAPASVVPVLVGLYTSSTCTTGQIGSDDSFAVPAGGGTVTGATSFVGAVAGNYYYKISYAGDTNNTGFSSCAESVGVTITSLP